MVNFGFLNVVTLDTENVKRGWGEENLKENRINIEKLENGTLAKVEA